jgi:hypothetical protein
MSLARALAAPFALLALRRAVPIWAGIRLVSAAVLFWGGALERLWHVQTALWCVAMAVLLLAVRERTEWREGALLGNLGVPRASLTVLAGTAVVVLEVLAQLVAARVLA